MVSVLVVGGFFLLMVGRGRKRKEGGLGKSLRGGEGGASLWKKEKESRGERVRGETEYV